MTRQLIVWLSWVLTSAVGGAYFGAMTNNADIFGQTFMPGLIVGVAQWLVLRHHLPNAGRWIPASALGWILGSFVLATIYGIIDPIVRIRPPWILSLVGMGTVYGAALGASQWLVLRGHTQHAGWWVFVSVVGGAVSWAVVPPALIPFGDTLTNGAIWAVHGAVTGMALVWLLL